MQTTGRRATVDRASNPRMRSHRASLLPALLGMALCAAWSDGRGEQPIADPPLYEHMASDDVLLADATVQRALEKALSEDARAWRNTSTGNEGTVTVERTWRTASGIYCRAYRETLTIGKRTELYRAIACRDPDGIWRPGS